MSKQNNSAQLRQTQINTFGDGLNMDLHPLTTSNTILTDCINGTMITYNDNEFVLQNERGNSKVEGGDLTNGFYPVAMKEHNNILYIVSYNPEQQKTEIGSYPSPTQNNDQLGYNDNLNLPWLNGDIDTLCEKNIYLPKDLNTDIIFFQQEEKQMVSSLDTYQLNFNNISIPSIYNLEFFAKSKSGVIETINLEETILNEEKHFPNRYLAYIGYRFRVPFLNSINIIRTDSGDSKKYGDDLKLEINILSEDNFLERELSKTLSESDDSSNFKLYLYTKYYFTSLDDNAKDINLVAVCNSEQNGADILDESFDNFWVRWPIASYSKYGLNWEYQTIPLEFNGDHSVKTIKTNVCESWAPKLYFPDYGKLQYDEEARTLFIDGKEYTKFVVEYYPVIEFTHDCDENTKYLYFDELRGTFTASVYEVMSRNEYFDEFYYSEKENGDLSISAILNLDNYFGKKLGSDIEKVNTSYIVGSWECISTDQKNTVTKQVNNYEVNWSTPNASPDTLTAIKNSSAHVSNGDLYFSKWLTSEGYKLSQSKELTCLGSLPSKIKNVYTINNGLASIKQEDSDTPICYVEVIDGKPQFNFTINNNDWSRNQIYILTFTFDASLNDQTSQIANENYNNILSNFNENFNISLNQNFLVADSTKPTTVPNLDILKSVHSETIDSGTTVSFYIITTTKMLANEAKGRMDRLGPEYWFTVPENYIKSNIVENPWKNKNNIGYTEWDSKGENLLQYLAHYTPWCKEETEWLTPDKDNFDGNKSKIPFQQAVSDVDVSFNIDSLLNNLYGKCTLTFVNGELWKEYKTHEESTNISSSKFSVKSSHNYWIDVKPILYENGVKVRDREYLFGDMVITNFDHLKLPNIDYGKVYLKYHFEDDSKVQNHLVGGLDGEEALIVHGTKLYFGDNADKHNRDRNTILYSSLPLLNI